MKIEWANAAAAAQERKLCFSILSIFLLLNIFAAFLL